MLASDLVKYVSEDVPDLEMYLTALDWVNLNDQLYKNENNPEKLKKLYN